MTSTSTRPLYSTMATVAILTQVTFSLHMPSSAICPTCSYRQPASSVEVNCRTKLKHHSPDNSKSYTKLAYRGL